MNIPTETDAIKILEGVAGERCPLFPTGLAAPLGLTQMSLLAKGYATDYN